MKSRSILISIFLLSLILISLPAHAMVPVTCFEGEFVRDKGKPFTESFTFPAVAGPATIRLTNNNINSATVNINGVEVFGPSDFNQNVEYLEATVTLNEGNNNTIDVTLKSKPGSSVNVSIEQFIDDRAGYVKPVPASNIVYDDRSGIEIVKNQLIVIFERDLPEEVILNIIDSINGTVVGYIPDLSLYQVEFLDLSTIEELYDLIESLKVNSNFLHVSRNTVHDLSLVPQTGNDPMWFYNISEPDTWNQQYPGGRNWGLEAIKMPSAWDITTGGTSVKVGVVDGGFLLDHIDIMLPPDNGFGANGQVLSDDQDIENCFDQTNATRLNNHGTHVSGIIGAESDNPIGITGIMWVKDLYVYRTTFKDTDILYGANLLLLNGVKIINFSIGRRWWNPETCIVCDDEHVEECPSADDPEDSEWFIEQRELYSNAMDSWINSHGEFLIVQSAGNSVVPAIWNGLFSTLTAQKYKEKTLIVGSISQPQSVGDKLLYNLSFFSNYGPRVDIVAPGDEIYSTIANYPYYEKKSGTSMAAPNVTGVAGLVWNLAENNNVNLTASQVRNILVNTANDERNFIDERGYEYTILNAQAAVNAVLDNDEDGVINFYDSFPDDPNEWDDTDLDGVGDNSDQCPDTDLFIPGLPINGCKPYQLDDDEDGISNDGSLSGIMGDNPCTGGNTINCDDNCPNDHNPDQADSDGNGIGDACEIGCNVTRWDLRYYHSSGPNSNSNDIFVGQMLIYQPDCTDIVSATVTDQNGITYELACNEPQNQFFYNTYDEIPTGNYEFIVNHQNGNTYTCQDTYTPGSLPIPEELVNWSNGDFTYTVTPFIDWNDVPGATHYWVRFWDSTRTNIIYDSRDHIGYTSETKHTVHSGFLEPYTMYLLEVFAADEPFEHGSFLRIFLSTNPNAKISTFHQNNDNYDLYIRFFGDPDISTVTVTGPPESGLENGVLYDDGQHIDGDPNDGIFSNNLFNLLTRPNVGDVYVFDFIQNGYSDQVQASISGVVDSFATLISPSGLIDPVQPTFLWALPSDTSSIDGQQIVVFKNGEEGAPWLPEPSWWIWSKNLDIDVTSVTFNDDGTATEALTKGETYYWGIRLFDESGNTSHTYQMSFTYGFDNVPPTVVSTNPPDGATGVSRDLEWISVTFNEEMNRSQSVTSISYLSWPLSGSTPITWSEDGKTFSISRDNAGTPLPPGETLEFVLNPPGYTFWFQDLAGNELETYTFSFTTESGPNFPVYFPDPNLEAAIREAIGKPEPEEILYSDLQVLTELYAYNRGIIELEGIQYCSNLTYLYLYTNQIGDITALGNLANLTELVITENQISDISALGNLNNLTGLNIRENQISDITALANLVNLTYLQLSFNPISDITALANLVNLTVLDISATQISDITALANLVNLFRLVLSDNQISDISPLVSLTNLERLFLMYNQISDISALSSLVNLTRLNLSYNQIIDISPLAGLTNLGEDLNLSYNQISDISPLAGLTNVRFLILQNNQISDVNPLAGLTNLHELFLSYNQISDISPLAGLTIEELQLDNNQISDIGPLVSNLGFGSGVYINLEDNPLSTTSCYIYIPELESRGANVSNNSCAPLSPPNLLSATYNSANDYNWITWSSVEAADAYKLYWGTEPGVTKGSEYAGQTSSTVFSHTGVVGGWTYYYRVCAVNTTSGAESELSNERSVYVPVQPLSPPSLLSATYNSANDYNWITWSSVEAADAYKLYWGTEPGVTKGSEYAGQTSSTVFSHTGVVGGWTYYYRVCAVNTTTGAESELSNEMSVYVPVQIPSTPTGISATYQSANNWNYITWNAVDGATEYHVYWGTSSGVTKSSNMLTPTTTTDYGHSGVQSGYTYYYRVASYNSAGESGLSAEVSAYIP